ncbi:MAG TPA: ATP-binding cassette domain-containing protein [Rhodopila sp.]|nr:ATP-binding cassette domain-containing protein [Rhodopila sp.]
MPPPLLALQDIALTYGATPLLTGAALSVSAGDRVCLVGRNGSGKSTLLKIAAGLVEPDAGRRFAQPGATIRYLPQEPDFAGFDTTLAYVESGMPGAAEGDRYRAAYLLEQLGLTGAEDPANLSGGEARRTALARVLAPEPDILLLDEPTNHLDLPGIEWLEAELGAMKSALVLISHDRRMLERMSRSTVWLDRGLTRVLDQGFAQFEAWRDQVLEQEELERHKLGRKIVMEEDWLRYGVTARRKRNVKRLADLHALRKRHKEQRAAVGKVRMEAAEADISGRLVIVAEDMSKAYDGRTVVRDVSIRVIRGDRLGIVGPNGAGKTTLLNMLTGKLTPDTGSVKLGTNLQEVTLDQRRDSLDPDRTLVQTLTGGQGDTVTVNGQNRHVMSYMKDFLFAPEQANTPVGVLSGGERGRLTLALAFAQPSNLMVLDEPTNDLDLETLELLQERLAEYSGTVLLVSHDRDFLDRAVTSVIASEGDGRWIEYAGGYSDMLTQRGPVTSQDVRGARATARSAEKPKPAQAAKPASRKLSFKDKHALETLPGRMADLAKEIAGLNAALADPDLYGKQPARFAEATRTLEAAQVKLSEAEEQWLTLEMLREELERA